MKNEKILIDKKDHYILILIKNLNLIFKIKRKRIDRLSFSGRG